MTHKRCSVQRSLLWGPCQAAGIWPGCRDLARLQGSGQVAVTAAGCGDRCPKPMSLRSRRSRALGPTPSTQPRAHTDSPMASVSLELIAVAGMQRSRGVRPRGRGPISPGRGVSQRRRPEFASRWRFSKSNRLPCIRVDNGCPAGLGSPHLTPGGGRSNGRHRLPQGH